MIHNTNNADGKRPCLITLAGLCYMARSGGFEPPTAWFVARYSIQLSYERKNLYQIAMRICFFSFSTSFVSI